MKAETITCREVENLLQPYLENRLGYAELSALLKHLDNCAECRDELEIRYLLQEGIKRAEEGKSLDMRRDLSERITRSKAYVLNVERLKNGVFLVEGAAFLLLLAGAVMFVINVILPLLRQ